eukprot:5803167-Alexandrium_andersonii.AAC.1
MEAVLAGLNVESQPWITPWVNKVATAKKAIEGAKSIYISIVQGSPDPAGAEKADKALNDAQAFQGNSNRL